VQVLFLVGGAQSLLIPELDWRSECCKFVTFLRADDVTTEVMVGLYWKKELEFLEN
jgi:hypothetical protein